MKTSVIVGMIAAGGLFASAVIMVVLMGQPPGIQTAAFNSQFPVVDPVCGNGIIEEDLRWGGIFTENCEPPGTNDMCDSGYCNTDVCQCTSVPVCGNGLLEFGERCENPWRLSDECDDPEYPHCDGQCKACVYLSS
jgi:hypothetical protein